LEVASPVSLPPYRASFFGLYYRLLGVRVSRWSARFEECLVASSEAQDFAEDLGSVEASVPDLIIVEEAEDLAGSSRTWDFGPSLMTENMIEELQRLGVFGEAKARPPHGETIPRPQAADAVVFRDFFSLRPSLRRCSFPSPSFGSF
jgi:hypothetical protein